MLSDFEEGAAMGQGHDVIIVKRASDLPEQIAERLHAEGFATVSVPNLSGIEKEIEGLNDPIFLIETGTGTPADVEFFTRLVNSTPVFKHGVVLVGRGAKSYLSALSESFILALAVTSPGTPSQIIQALRDAADMLPIAREKGGMPAPEKAPAGAAPLMGVEKESPRAPQTEPEHFFKHMQNLSLGKTIVGGGHYTSAIDAGFLKSRNCFPDDPRAQAIIDRVCADAGKWGRNHLYRVCYLTHSIASTLKLPSDALSASLSGAFLWAWSFAGDKEDLLRQNYARESMHDLRRDLASRVKDSALLAASELRDSRLTDILAKLGRILANEELPGTDIESTAASAILGADLMDRACFHDAYWDSRAAYSLLKKFKEARMPELHPAVCCVLIKLLSEAIAANPATVLVPKGMRTNSKFMQSARAARRSPAEPGERKVDLSELLPGMKLSKPLVSFDGRQILDQDLTLDEDLVWRIWQLSAIRPINPAKVVNFKK